jgi:hypothetical protein
MERSSHTVRYNLDPATKRKTLERSLRWYHENTEEASERKRRWYHENSDQLKEKSARQYRENPEKYQERTARWRRENPEPVRQMARRHYSLKRSSRYKSLRPLTLGQRSTRFALFGDSCAYCGDTGRLEADHVLALTAGGLDEVGNIVPACRWCNASKQAKPVEAWYRAQPFFTEKSWAKIQRHCPNASKGQLMLGIRVPSRAQGQ